MKMKLVPIIIVGLLVMTSINIIASEIEPNYENDIVTVEENIQFSKPTVDSKGEYISLAVAEATTNLRKTGEPMIPVFTKTYKFPLGSRGINVEFTHSELKQEIISGIIEPCPEPLPLNAIKKSQVRTEKEVFEDINVYSSSELYPDKWFNYRVGCGLDGLERVIFVTIYCYPARYSPLENTIQYFENLNVKINYIAGQSQIPQQGDYDLVIIAPSVFTDTIQPLVEHKNSYGVQTTIMTVEEIYDSYPGRDNSEQIKYYIKDAIETHNIKYVLLIGNRQGYTKNWYVPVRYSGLEDRGGWNETYVSDLYFADIYKGEGEFEDWDSNGNDIFAEWSWIWNPEWNWWSNDIDQKDILDLYPDVYVGRLACIDVFEVYTAVNKIIKYEQTTSGKSWFNKMIVAGGDTAPYGDGYYEGEEENELAASFMEPLGFEIIRLWASTGTLTGSADFISAVRKGSGFLYLAGHGSPIVWSTHPPDDTETWIDALFNHQMLFLLNMDRLPVCVVGGCHNSQFDVGFATMIEGIKNLGLKYFTWIVDEDCFDKMGWIPSCWSWNLIKRGFGGTIATIGNTGLGWGSIGEGSTEDLDGWITTHFFEAYSNLYEDEDCTLGMVHSKTITDYIDTFSPNDDELDRKTVEQWVLLGDPSLKIGGYPS